MHMYKKRIKGYILSFRDSEVYQKTRPIAPNFVIPYANHQAPFSSPVIAYMAALWVATQDPKLTYPSGKAATTHQHPKPKRSPHAINGGIQREEIHAVGDETIVQTM